MQIILLGPTLIYVPMEIYDTRHNRSFSLSHCQETTATIQDMQRALHGWGPLEVYEGEHIYPSYITKAQETFGVFHLHNEIRILPCTENGY
jgi:hypothetical protein